MSEQHAHQHQADHHHGKVQASLAKPFVAGIFLNLLFVVIELIAGIRSNSLSLLSDAWHNLSDVSTLAISLLVLKLSEKKASKKFTYGYHKGTILGALASAVLLLVAVGSIGWEAIQRFYRPEPASGSVMIIVAAAGIVVNAVSALLFFRHRHEELNARAAYLHLAMDALVSAGVVVSGILIYCTGWQWMDPLTSIIIMLVLIYNSWNLLLESFNLSMDAVPPAISVDKIAEQLMKQKGVEKAYHIHVWALSTTRNALTAHLLLDKNLNAKQIAEIKSRLRHELEHMGIQHATFETEVHLD